MRSNSAHRQYTKYILTIPSPINLFKNLPDSGRHVTSQYQGLFAADRRERRKEPGYEVVFPKAERNCHHIILQHGTEMTLSSVDYI